MALITFARQCVALFSEARAFLRNLLWQPLDSSIGAVQWQLTLLILGGGAYGVAVALFVLGGGAYGVAVALFILGSGAYGVTVALFHTLELVQGCYVGIGG